MYVNNGTRLWTCVFLFTQYYSVVATSEGRRQSQNILAFHGLAEIIWKYVTLVTVFLIVGVLE